jgi:transposase
MKIMSRILKGNIREQLLVQHKCERDKLVCDRIKCVLAYDDGYEPVDISKIVLLSVSTVQRYINDYLENEKLSPNHHGSESKLSLKDEQKLITYLQKNTYRYTKDICLYVKKEFKVEYCVSGMTKWLHAHGFCYKKPHGVPAKANEETQKKFMKEYLKLKKEAAMANEVILFGDSSHPQHQTQLAYGWILKGERKAVPMTATQRRVNVMGAINLDGHIVQSMTAETINAETFEIFLKKLRKCYGDKNIHLILDNASYHTSKVVKASAEKLNIKIHYLPPYSPNLNAIERLWKIMKEVVSYNQYYAKFEEFKSAIESFFKNIKQYKSTLRTRITDNFQIINSPLASN